MTNERRLMMGNKQGRPRCDDRNERIVHRYVVEGDTMRAIGKDEGISIERVRQILCDNGIYHKRDNQKRVKMRRLYRFIAEYKIKTNGNTPTLNEMIDGAKLSVYFSTVNTLLDLEEAGLIKIHVGKSGNRTFYRVSLIGETYTPPDGWEDVMQYRE